MKTFKQTVIILLTSLFGTILFGNWAAAQMINREAFEIDRKGALDLSQNAMGRTVGDYAFRDIKGKKVMLSEFLGQPIIVNMIYTSCERTCPLIVDSLIDAVESAEVAVGSDKFTILTIGFDSRVDSPYRMRVFADTNEIEGVNWQVLSADQMTIDRLSKDLGFTYYRSPQGIDHLAQVSVVSADGVLYRQVYGETFEPQFLVEPIKDLVLRRDMTWTSVDGLVNRFKLFCTKYDATANRYRIDYSVFIALTIGGLALLGMGTALFRIFVSARKNDQHGTPV